MITFPNARITLGLWVTGRRPDGFHDIETLMVPIPLYDALEAVPSPDGDTRLSLSGLPVPDDGRLNLCLQAYELMQEMLTSRHEAGKPRRQPTISPRSSLSRRSPLPPLHIHLHKGIPAGAGLAGGSADAAFMLKLLNNFITPPLTTGELTRLAEKPGSDCPFFINNEPALASGRGNILATHDVPADFHNHRLEIVTPHIHLRTAEAYRRIRPKERSTSLASLLHQPIPEWKHLIVNDFEEVVFAMHPEIADIKARLYAQGAVYASLSGSGSAVYALF
jgi:4-diphosphocytidyl-2-C-methyl-D-erythritol kinase